MPTDLCLPSDALVCCYTFVNMSEIAKTGQDLSQKEINQGVKVTVLVTWDKGNLDQPRQLTSKILMGPSILPIPQLTPNVQVINAYFSMLMRFRCGLLLSITVVIDYSYRHDNIQVYFFLLIGEKKVRDFLIKIIKYIHILKGLFSFKRQI